MTLLKDMTVREVEYALSHYKDDGDGGFSWYDWADAMTRYNRETKEHDVLIHEVQDFHVQVLEDFGGEGKGDSMYVVFKAFDLVTVRHFKMNGYYASYTGGDWDGPFEEVKPIVRQVTFYE